MKSTCGSDIYFVLGSHSALISEETSLIIDTHVHTNISSRCSCIMPDELFERASELGLDAFCVTEHNVFKGAQVVYEAGLKRGYTVFRGIEVYTELGDMLVFGWQGEIRYYLTPFSELKREVDSSGGLIIPAHPCRGLDVRHQERETLPEELVSSIVAIETHNGLNSSKGNELAEAIRDRYGLFGTGGSDAHHVRHLGACVTIFDDCPQNDEEFVEALREGRYRPAYYDEVTDDDFGCGEKKFVTGRG